MKIRKNNYNSIYLGSAHINNLALDWYGWDEINQCKDLRIMLITVYPPKKKKIRSQNLSQEQNIAIR